MEEIWKVVPGFAPGTEASNLGRIRAPRRTGIEILEGHRHYRQPQYRLVNLKKPDGSFFTTSWHRVVFMAFHGPIPRGLEVDHIDHDPTNNRADNLQAIPRVVNMAKSWERRRARGHTAMHKNDKHCKRGHEYTPENTWIAATGYRYCRECQRLRYHLKKERLAA